jgi:hypothetical protein
MPLVDLHRYHHADLWLKGYTFRRRRRAGVADPARIRFDKAAEANRKR